MTQQPLGRLATGAAADGLMCDVYGCGQPATTYLVGARSGPIYMRRYPLVLCPAHADELGSAVPVEPVPLAQCLPPDVPVPDVTELLAAVLNHDNYIGRGALLSACTPLERRAFAEKYGRMADVPDQAAHDRMWLWIVGWRHWRTKLLGYAWPEGVKR